MKKLLLLLCLFSANQLFGQNVKWGVKAGVNWSEISQANGSQTTPTGTLTINTTTNKIPGYHVGVFSNIEFEKISINPALIYTTKGGSYIADRNFVSSSGSSFSERYTNKTTLNYLELPVNILYNIPLKKGKFFIGGGPYAAIALSGKFNYTSDVTNYSQGVVVNSTSNSGQAPVIFGSDTNNLKKTDFGLGLLGGVGLNNGLLFSANYVIGLYNTINSNTYNYKNRVLSLSIGYYL